MPKNVCHLEKKLKDRKQFKNKNQNRKLDFKNLKFKNLRINLLLRCLKVELGRTVL